MLFCVCQMLIFYLITTCNPSYSEKMQAFFHNVALNAYQKFTKFTIIYHIYSHPLFFSSNPLFFPSSIKQCHLITAFTHYYLLYFIPRASFIFCSTTDLTNLAILVKTPPAPPCIKPISVPAATVFTTSP